MSTAGSLFLNFSKNGSRGVAGGSAAGALGTSCGGETMRSRRLSALIGLVGEEAIPAACVVGVMFGDILALGEGSPAKTGDFWE